jgi:hypothetical protein
MGTVPPDLPRGHFSVLRSPARRTSCRQFDPGRKGTARRAWGGPLTVPPPSLGATMSDNPLDSDDVCSAFDRTECGFRCGAAYWRTKPRA